MRCRRRVRRYVPSHRRRPDPARATSIHARFTSAGAGAFVMRSAGCTINDMWDRNYDGRVARTAQRPLAARRLTMLQAWTFLGAQLSVGLAILLQLNWATIELGVASVGIVAAYPLMKRFTHFPQVSVGCFEEQHGLA